MSKGREILRRSHGSHHYTIKPVPASELGIQRFRFASQLIRAAGFQGWVLLFDEVELIGRYSALQRGRSYAELARWLGKGGEFGCHGTLAVAAITDDFVSVVLDEKGDAANLVPKLRERGTEEHDRIARMAEAGMRAIQREALPLEAPDSTSLLLLNQRLRQIYSSSFRWKAPPIDALSRPRGHPSPGAVSLDAGRSCVSPRAETTRTEPGSEHFASRLASRVVQAHYSCGRAGRCFSCDSLGAWQHSRWNRTDMKCAASSTRR